VVKTALVDRDIEVGRDLIVALDDSDLSPAAALWFYEPETSVWRLVLGMSEVALKGPTNVYSSLQRILAKPRWSDRLSLQDISLLEPNAALLKTLRSAVRTGSRDLNGIRFTRNTINGTFVEDAYIYRLS
jgi:hypothetical protein